MPIFFFVFAVVNVSAANIPGNPLAAWNVIAAFGSLIACGVSVAREVVADVKEGE